ncbi:hypothetical protein CHARACLAT_033540 [Characodon lateralis]|uniref:Uncharacterized protein n=1 Tax=Characodon lateralis TaxID=208331 RepID=A0ABU7EF22_9TELE|nr:hypothetical protein [Characodon lateralis]
MTSSSVTASFSAPPLILACRQTHHILTHTYIMKGYKDQIVKLKKRKKYKINLYSIIPTATFLPAHGTSFKLHALKTVPVYIIMYVTEKRCSTTMVGYKRSFKCKEVD